MTNIAIKKYEVSEETSAILKCVENVLDVQTSIQNALTLNYGENRVAIAGVKSEEGKIGYKIFEALSVVRDELFKVMEEGVMENLCNKTEDVVIV